MDLTDWVTASFAAAAAAAPAPAEAPVRPLATVLSTPTERELRELCSEAANAILMPRLHGGIFVTRDARLVRCAHAGFSDGVVLHDLTDDEHTTVTPLRSIFRGHRLVLLPVSPVQLNDLTDVLCADVAVLARQGHAVCLPMALASEWATEGGGHQDRLVLRSEIDAQQVRLALRASKPQPHCS